jgi:uncharacterized protein Yka (UPF0111/DUF47 family)
MRRETKVFATILRYADEIVLTASALRDLMGSLIGDRDGKVLEAYERLMEMAKADFTRRKLSEEISKGGFFANLRMLFLELVERMYKIADYSKDAGRLLYTSSSAGIDFSPCSSQRLCRGSSTANPSASKP